MKYLVVNSDTKKGYVVESLDGLPVDVSANIKIISTGGALVVNKPAGQTLQAAMEARGQ